MITRGDTGRESTKTIKSLTAYRKEPPWRARGGVNRQSEVILKEEYKRELDKLTRFRAPVLAFSTILFTCAPHSSLCASKIRLASLVPDDCVGFDSTLLKQLRNEAIEHEAEPAQLLRLPCQDRHRIRRQGERENISTAELAQS